LDDCDVIMTTTFGGKFVKARICEYSALVQMLDESSKSHKNLLRHYQG